MWWIGPVYYLLLTFAFLCWLETWKRTKIVAVVVDCCSATSRELIFFFVFLYSQIETIKELSKKSVHYYLENRLSFLSNVKCLLKAQNPFSSLRRGFAGQAPQKNGSVGRQKNKNKSYILITKARKLLVKLGKSWEKYEHDKQKTQKLWIEKLKNLKIQQKFSEKIVGRKGKENMACQKFVLFLFRFFKF